MGLALDEHDENENYIMNEDIKIAVDKKISGYFSTGNTITVDFQDSIYGSGFVVNGGSSC